MTVNWINWTNIHTDNSHLSVQVSCQECMSVSSFWVKVFLTPGLLARMPK